jgi:peptidoglycan/LPS O-acetylase OafA/YrhL
MAIFIGLGRLSWSGVDLFFVLSGFLIGGILLDAKDSPRYFATFYLRRAYRILPIYVVVVLSVFFLSYLPLPFLRSWIGSAAGIPFVSYATFTQNLWMAHLGTFGPLGLGMTWSLAIEEQFYLTIPLVIRRLNRSQIIRVLIGVVIGAPMLRTLLFFKFPHGNFADYVLMPCRADALCLGVLSAILVRDSRIWRNVVERRILLYWATVLPLAGVGWLTYKGYAFDAAPMVTFGYSVLALFYTCCLLIVLVETRVAQRVLCNKQLIRLGGISYCVYLIHGRLIAAGRYIFGFSFQHFDIHFPHSGGIVTFAGALFGIALTLVIAKVSWRILEQPMLQRGHAYKY